MVYETFSAEETEKLGEQIGREAKPGEVYTLIGDLGVGKTVFTQGIAKGLEITEPICSPTFTIVQELSLIHILWCADCNRCNHGGNLLLLLPQSGSAFRKIILKLYAE